MRSLPVWIAASLAAGAWTGLQLPLSQCFAAAALIVLFAATVTAFGRDDTPAVLWRALAGCMVAAWALASSGERAARATDVRAHGMRADARVARDLFRREPSRDEPEDLDLPVGQCEVRSRAI